MHDFTDEHGVKHNSPIAEEYKVTWYKDCAEISELEGETDNIRFEDKKVTIIIIYYVKTNFSVYVFEKL